MAPVLSLATAAWLAMVPGPQKADGLTLDLRGPVRERADAVVRNWLIPSPTSNPAMLAMFRDRDRHPYRDLLPWSGEFAGKHLTGATALLNLTGDPALKTSLEAFVPGFVEGQDTDGYLGPFPRDSRLTGSAPNINAQPGPTWDAWGHYHAILGLLAWHDRTGDPASLAAARKIGDLFVDRFAGDKKPRLVDTGSTEMNLAPAHGLALLYAHTKEQKYLDLALQLVGEFAAEAPDGKPLAGDYLRQGAANAPFFKTPKPRWESLHPIQALAELHRLTGDASHKSAFENLWWSIDELDRHNNGGFSSGEQAQGDPYHQGAIETCCTIAWMAMTVDMLRLSADSRAADELELSTLNSVLGFWSPTGRWSTYNTPMDGVRKSNYHEIVFQSRPGSPDLNCCSVNAARGIGLISEWALMSDDRGLFLNWYGPGTMVARSKPGGVPVTFGQETDYPRNGVVRISVTPSSPSRFALRLRIPHWSAATTVKVSGQPVADVKPGTYLELDRDWKPGDTIELGLDLGLRAWVGERASEGRVSLYRGPLLMTFDPRFNPGIDGDDPPAIDWKSLPAEAELEAAAGADFGVITVPAGGALLRLCDFSSAGAEGDPYRSWLRVTGAPSPEPFDRLHPDRSRPIGR